MSRINLKGLAVRSGLSKNNHKFLAEELIKAAQEQQGKTLPLIKDHEPTTDNTIGRVSFQQAVIDSQGDTVIPYTGFVLAGMGNTAMQIAEGVINEVSIGAQADQIVKESEESTELIPIGIHFMELSTTPTPAVAGTAITRASITAKTIIEQEATKMETPTQKVEDKVEVKQDLSAELSKLNDQIVAMKIEQAKKELEALKVVNVPEAKTVSAATAPTPNLFEGYIIERENGRLGIRLPNVQQKVQRWQDVALRNK